VTSVLPGADVHIFKIASCTEKKSCDPVLTLPPERRCPHENRTAEAAKDERCLALWRSGAHYVYLAVDDGAALAALTDADPAEIERARAVLESGGIVVTNPLYLKDGKAAINEIQFDAYLLRAEHPASAGIMSEAAAARAGFGSRPGGVIAATTSMPTQAERDRLDAALSGFTHQTQIHLEQGPQRDTDPIALVFALGAALIALAAAAIATGLAAADTRPDLVTLAAVGAAPRVRRLLSLSQAGVIAGLGSALGTATGLGAAAVLVFTLNRFYASEIMQRSRLPLAVPWDTIAIIVAVPLIAMAGAGLFTRSRLPVEQRP
jgi:putative ABC transport system permease protein